jgi:dipeptidyl aminopeptidase/acylaminoacyl peptidase
LSASLNADRIEAPLLVNAADSEYLASLALCSSLEQLGKPVELFIYPNELHAKNQPKHRYEIYERNLDWFGFWLRDLEDPDPKKADQYVRWRRLKKVWKEGKAGSASK